MEWFTPQFVLQLVIAVGSAGAMYGAVRSDLKHMSEKLLEESRLRELHESKDDGTHHDIRDELQTLVGRVSTIEGRIAQ